MVFGDCSIRFVKGESYPYAVVFDDIAELIESVSIVSQKIGFNKELTKDSKIPGRWFYTFSPEETSNFNANRGTYTLIVNCKGEELKKQKLTGQKIDVIEDENSK